MGGVGGQSENNKMESRPFPKPAGLDREFGNVNHRYHLKGFSPPICLNCLTAARELQVIVGRLVERGKSGFSIMSTLCCG